MQNLLKLSVLALMFMSQFLFAVQDARAQVGPDSATKLVFYNASNQDVAVGISMSACSAANYDKCAQEDGCGNGSLQNFKTIDLTENGAPTPVTLFTSVSKGWFMLKRGHRVQFLNCGVNPINGQPSACIQGMSFGFGAFSSTCALGTPLGGAATFPVTTPGPSFNRVQTIVLPNGSNGFEATINLPGTINGQAYLRKDSGSAYTSAPSQEFINLTCLSGANCTLNVQVSAPSSGPFWIAGGSTVNIKSPFNFQNSWVDLANKCDNNCIDPRTGRARLGVFPYGCSQCNIYPDPTPACGASTQFCAAINGLPPNNGCSFQRFAQVAGVQKFGGTIQVNYMGPLTPPGTCPPGSKH